MTAILVLHGPNLNLLGQREPGVYGTTTLAEVDAAIVAHAASRGVRVECRQSNHEGRWSTRCRARRAQGFAAIVINPGALTHYSYALRDAHRCPGGSRRRGPPLQRPRARAIPSPLRHRRGRRGQIAGFGVHSYTLGLDAALACLARR